METTISNFHTILKIPAIHKLAFHISHVQILGTNHCGDSRQTSFKRRGSCQDVLCWRDYAERVVAISLHQIPNPSPSIRIHVYNLIAHCTKHGRLLLTEKKVITSVNSTQQKYTL